MRKKIYTILNRIYGIMMTVSFFAGILPLIPFIIAIFIGGDIGANISIFLYKQFYPWVIVIGSAAILVGLIAMYVGKIEGLSVKKVSTNENDSSMNS
ncbi:MAG: hypothetical protein J6Q82_06290 [Clostridia bacterium]|nr:hypothetical protein [Clostridia bacterium]